MKSNFLTTCLAGAALLAAAVGNAAIINPQPVSPLGNVKVSTGRNLAARVSEARAEASKTSLKKLAPEKKTAKKGLSVRRSPMKSPILTESSVIYSEGFESVSIPEGYLSTTEFPAGWSRESHGEVESPEADKWCVYDKEFASQNLFIDLADGSKFVGIWYDDDLFTDEWLISPAITIPAEGYKLNFHWYTKPYYFYTIDRFHVDFDEGVFIDRELNCNVDIMVKVGGADWVKIYDIEQEFVNLEYEEIRDAYDYITYMPKVILSLDQFAGQDIQVAFRYYGQGDNSFYIDAVSVDIPGPPICYEPDYSRLFFGFNNDIWWLDTSIEFQPVNAPISYYNTSSKVPAGTEFNWFYTELNPSPYGYRLVEKYSDEPDMLTLQYTPDYDNADYGSLMNNLYTTPTLRARTPDGAISNYAPWVEYLQAGGTTEYLFDMEDGTTYHEHYVATTFDIIHEGLKRQVEADEELCVVDVPLFGYDVNHDAWWLKYTYPNGTHGDDSKYAYVDGFANMFLPHPTAPLVVKGVKAAAHGIIHDDAEFTLKIYTMDEDGYLVEPPIVTQTLLGKDVMQFSDGMTRKYLVLDFPFEQPIIFSAEGTALGYMVEISGYHDEKIESFCPLQAADPNLYGWSTSFYHKYTSLYNELDPDHCLTDEFCYTGYFKDEYGRDLECPFAIGLDAHYPWLMLYEQDEMTFTSVENVTAFTLRSYYDASQYKVEAPEWVDVELNGRYTIDVTVVANKEITENITVPVTFSAPGVKLTVDVPFSTVGAVGSIEADTALSGNVYNAQGMLMLRNATAADVNKLPAGLYIYNGKKFLVK